MIRVFEVQSKQIAEEVEAAKQALGEDTYSVVLGFVNDMVIAHYPIDVTWDDGETKACREIVFTVKSRKDALGLAKKLEFDGRNLVRRIEEEEKTAVEAPKEEKHETKATTLICGCAHTLSHIENAIREHTRRAMKKYMLFVEPCKDERWHVERRQDGEVLAGVCCDTKEEAERIVKEVREGKSLGEAAGWAISKCIARKCAERKEYKE